MVQRRHRVGTEFLKKVVIYYLFTSLEKQPSKVTKKKSANKVKGKPAARWKWTDAMTEKVIDCVYEYKTKKDFECKDMESDLVQFYSDIRLMMSQLYPAEFFGPEETTPIEGADDIITARMAIL